MRPDVVIGGAGLIGMACALECQRRGLQVAILEKGRAGLEASWAAAGMLAARDPANPSAMQELSLLSLDLYPAFLSTLTEATGVTIPFQTEWTLQEAEGAQADAVPLSLSPDNLRRIPEQSLDPRQLSATALAAVKARGIEVREGTTVVSVVSNSGGIEIHTAGGNVHGGAYLDCTGAWSASFVRPAKGQMLRLNAPGALLAESLGNVVVRTHDVYLVPRLDGSVVVGATVEDVGFDKAVRIDDMERLLTLAAALLPTLHTAPVMEQWAGLRPASVDGLPLIGSRSAAQADTHVYTAAGHFRNGILLAPATAHVMAQLLHGETPSVDLHAFRPDRKVLNPPGPDEAHRLSA